MVRTSWKRRSVRRDVRRFVGWAKIIELANKLKNSLDRALFATTFLTGGRIKEVLALTTSNFVVDDRYITVVGMPLLKRYQKVRGFKEERDELPKTTLARLYQQDEKTGKWWRKRFDTKRTEETRIDFHIKRDEPLCAIMLNHIKKIKSGPLFAGISRWIAYRKFREIGIYPHWLRAQRASCLISFWRFPMEDMMEWMGWEELTTARHYAKMGPKLRERFEQVQIPQGIKGLELAAFNPRKGGTRKR